MNPATRPTEADARPGDPPRAKPGVSLHWQILIGLAIGMVSGTIAEALLPTGADGSPHAGLDWFSRNIADPIGQVFMRLIFMVVLPLLFSALTLGVAELGDVRKLGRIGLWTLGFTLLLSGLSVLIGVGLVNALRPGEHLDPAQRAALHERYASQASQKVEQASHSKPLRDTLLDLIPRNPLQEAVGALDGSSPGGGILAVMFFALTVGVALASIGPRAEPVLAVLRSVYDATLVIVAFAMKLAPIGVAGLSFTLAATLGLDIFRTLGGYVLTVLVGLALHMFGVYSLVVRFIAGMSPWRFFSQTSDALLTAFATSSSNATLPTTLRVAQENLGIRREISGFVLTVGSTANQNGTALYEGITVLFLAQVFGVPLDLTAQLTVVLMCILAGVGTAGVPGGSLPLVVLVLQTVRVPPEAIGIILGVDRLLDMCRTTLNVAGDIAVAACVHRFESRSKPPSR